MSQNTNDSAISQTRSGRAYHSNNGDIDDASSNHVIMTSLFACPTNNDAVMPDDEPLS